MPLLLVMKYEEIHVDLINMTNSIVFFEEKFTVCKESWPNLEMKLIYNIFLAFFLFLFPLIFMSYAYINVSQTLCFTESNQLPIIKKVKIVNTFSVQQSIKYKVKKQNEDKISQFEFDEDEENEKEIVLKEKKREISYSHCSSENVSVAKIFETNQDEIEMLEKIVKTDMKNSKKSKVSKL